MTDYKMENSRMIAWVCLSCALVIFLPYQVEASLYTSTRFSREALQFRDYLKAVEEESPCGLACLGKIMKEVESRDYKTPIIKRKGVRDTRQDGGEFDMNVENRATSPESCLAPPVELQFDCSPERERNEAECLAKGCCYHNDAHQKAVTAPELSYPKCFYPRDYVSYKFVSLENTSMGMTGGLVKVSDSGFPGDAMNLTIAFLYETNSRIRIRIYDPSDDERWETPFPETPDVAEPAANPMYSLKIDPDRGTFAIERKSNSVPLFDTRNAGPLIYSTQFLQISSLLPSSYIYGLGQHFEGLLLDMNWQRRFLWNYDTGPKINANLYGSHALYLNLEGDGNAHGVFLLNSNGIDAILQPTPAISFRPIGGILDLYVFLGPTPSDVIQQYTDVIGKPFLPPYWSLGYHQCRYNYFTLNETMRIWNQTIEARIPFDVQWNDIDSMDNFKDFTYDPVAFEGFPEFVDHVHEVGMKYVLVTDPGLDADDTPGTYFPYDNGTKEEIFIVYSNETEFIGDTWIIEETAYPDFTKLRTHILWQSYLKEFHKELEFDGIWLDMNEPTNFDNWIEVCDYTNPLNNPPYLPPNSEQQDKWLYYRTVCLDTLMDLGIHYDLHNLYGTLESVATSNALKAIRNERPFVITRSSFAGLGKYAGHWTGDTASTWFQMWQSIPDVLNFNLFGIPMVGSDICGFGEDTTVNLCTQWYQLGAFYPFARNHNNEGNIDQDPVSLGEPVITSARNSLFVRYRLLPFLYSLLFRSHLSGEPVMKPLFFAYPEDTTTYSIDTEFMWGEALLFTPNLIELSDTVSAYVPSGRWYDWFSGELFLDTPGEYVDIPVEYDELMPLIYLKGGYVIPTQVPEVTTEASRLNDFELEMALDEIGNATGFLYWDDGVSLDTMTAKLYNHILFSASNSMLQTTISQSGIDMAMPLGNIRIMGIEGEVSTCTLDGKAQTCSYDSQTQVLTADLSSNEPPIDLLTELNFTWQ